MELREAAQAALDFQIHQRVAAAAVGLPTVAQLPVLAAVHISAAAAVVAVVANQRRPSIETEALLVIQFPVPVVLGRVVLAVLQIAAGPAKLAMKASPEN